MFEPINDTHAIEEVAFAITFERNFDERAVGSLFATHQKQFRRELPRAERQAVMQLNLGPQPPMAVVPPLQFAAFKRDGNFDWRLYVENDSIIINCRTYTGWADVSARALELLIKSFPSLIIGNNGVKHIALQYVNAFKWKDKAANYSLTSLLNASSGYVPLHFVQDSKGPLWHLHQGWFSAVDGIFPNKTLHRIHFDAILEGGTHLVRMETVLRADLLQPVRKLGDLFFEGGGGLRDAFEKLHDVDKQLTASYLSDEMTGRINLFGVTS